MPDNVSHHSMTDERPATAQQGSAEPDTTGVADAAGRALVHASGWNMTDSEHNAALAAVEAAARTLAIEFAESRVRAIQTALFSPDADEAITAELAALARLKGEAG